AEPELARAVVAPAVDRLVAVERARRVEGGGEHQDAGEARHRLRGLELRDRVAGAALADHAHRVRAEAAHRAVGEQRAGEAVAGGDLLDAEAAVVEAVERALLRLRRGARAAGAGARQRRDAAAARGGAARRRWVLALRGVVAVAAAGARAAGVA